jgi:DNA-binding Lrp family transcriptional regulator
MYKGIDKIEKKILLYLKKHPEGTMILDLADALGVHRHTVIKYLYRLEGMGKIKIRKVGIAKLCYLV